MRRKTSNNETVFVTGFATSRTRLVGLAISTVAALAACLILQGTGTSAIGQISYVSQSASVSATACETSSDSSMAIGTLNLDVSEFCEISMPFDFLQGTAAVNVQEASPMIVSVSGDASAMSGCCSGGASGLADFSVTFTLASEVPYQLVGEIEAVTFNGNLSNSMVSLTGPTGEVFASSIFSIGEPPNPGGTIVFDESGVLTSGEYTLSASANAFGNTQADFSDGSFFGPFVSARTWCAGGMDGLVDALQHPANCHCSRCVGRGARM